MIASGSICVICVICAHLRISAVCPSAEDIVTLLEYQAAVGYARRPRCEAPQFEILSVFVLSMTHRIAPDKGVLAAMAGSPKGCNNLAWGNAP